MPRLAAVWLNANAASPLPLNPGRTNTPVCPSRRQAPLITFKPRPCGFSEAFLGPPFTAAPKSQTSTPDITAPSVWHQPSWWRRSPDTAVSVLLPTPAPPPDTGRSFRRSAAPSCRVGPGFGLKPAVPTPDSRFPATPLPFARRRFSFARTALRHGFGMENPASRTLFSTPANRCHRLFTFFLLAISTT